MSLSLSQSYSLNSWLFKYTVYLEGSLSTASAGRKRQKWKDWFTILVQTMSSSIKGKLHINWFATLVKTVSSGFKGKLHIKACLQTLGNTTASVKKEDNKCEVVKVLKWYPLIQCCFRMKSTSGFPFLLCVSTYGLIGLSQQRIRVISLRLCYRFLTLNWKSCRLLPTVHSVGHTKPWVHTDGPDIDWQPTIALVCQGLVTLRRKNRGIPDPSQTLPLPSSNTVQ